MGDLAEVDNEALGKLVAEIDTESEALGKMLKQLAIEAKVVPKDPAKPLDLGGGGAAPKLGDPHRCPRCGFEFAE